ncbi:MAG: hypothetical protein ACI8RZ_008053 [Myxococcota bacterium]|jgi:hypothetical protein
MIGLLLVPGCRLFRPATIGVGPGGPRRQIVSGGLLLSLRHEPLLRRKPPVESDWGGRRGRHQ